MDDLLETPTHHSNSSCRAGHQGVMLCWHRMPPHTRTRVVLPGCAASCSSRRPPPSPPPSRLPTAVELHAPCLAHPYPHPGCGPHPVAQQETEGGLPGGRAALGGELHRASPHRQSHLLASVPLLACTASESSAHAWGASYKHARLQAWSAIAGQGRHGALASFTPGKLCRTPHGNCPC